MRGSFKRIQFTPDLVPADLVGTRIYNQKTGEFTTSLGPVFTNLLLADEINRAPAKVQSALLEVMQERQVTIAGETHKVPEPFLVMATQNPIETEGTYPLPEAQVDRFMMKVLVGYPSEEEEFVIVERVTGVAGDGQRRSRAPSSSPRCSSECRKVYVDPSLIQYAVRLVGRDARARSATASPTSAKYLTFGASPRASIHLIEGARALAFLRGRDYALPEDVTDLVPDVLRHRLVLSYEALAEGAHRRRARSSRVMKHDPGARQAAARRHVRVAAQPPADAEALLRRLEWTVLRRLDGLLQGDYRTLFRGSGLDLADLREYQHHDDVRHIDWNVTARLQTPYVREFTRGPRDHRLVPARPQPVGRLRLGPTCSKRDVSRASSSPCWRACSRATATASARCSTASEVDAMIPARSGRRHVLHLLHAHAGAAGRRRRAGATDLRRAAARAAQRRCARRSLVFVVSDFISAPGWEERARRSWRSATR